MMFCLVKKCYSQWHMLVVFFRNKEVEAARLNLLLLSNLISPVIVDLVVAVMNFPEFVQRLNTFLL